MSNTAPAAEQDPMIVGNYCVCFIDLLGQRAALRGQSLVPQFQTEEDKQRWLGTLKDSVGSIASLQKHAQEMMDAAHAEDASPLRSELPTEMQATWNAIRKTKVTTQRWSDGLVSFAWLGDPLIKCQLNNIYSLFTLAGSLCLLGLASKRPLRGAIEVAWGVELHPGELYGGNRLDPDSYHAPTTSRFGFANSAGIGGSAGAGRPIRAA